MSTRNAFHLRAVSMVLVLCFLTMPVLAQQAETSALTAKRIAEIRAEAAADAKVMDKTGEYFAAGLFCGIIGYVIAATNDPQVPAEKLVEYSDAERQIYTEAYKEAAKKNRKSAACGGWGLGVLSYVIYSVIASAGK